MGRGAPQPFHPAVTVFWVGLAGADVDLAGDGLVDDGLLLLLKQRNQLLPTPNIPINPLNSKIKKPSNSPLLGEWRLGHELYGEISETKVCGPFAYAFRQSQNPLTSCHFTHSVRIELGVSQCSWLADSVHRRALAVGVSHTNRSGKSIHCVDYEIAATNALIPNLLKRFSKTR